MLIKKDLVGVPQEIIERMKDCQVEQGNRKNAKVFDNVLRSPIQKGGFAWVKTREGYNFWEDVLIRKQYDKFFELYPKGVQKELIKEYTKVAPDYLDKIKVEGEVGGVKEVKPKFEVIDEHVYNSAIVNNDYHELYNIIIKMKIKTQCVIIPMMNNQAFTLNYVQSLGVGLKDTDNIDIAIHIVTDEGMFAGVKLWRLS